MGWPPRVGELLPRAEEAFGVREKLATYSLSLDHHRGGSKARGFEAVLGISMASVDHLEAEIQTGILKTPITAIRKNPPHGINCVVDFPIRGVGKRSAIAEQVRTVWLVRREAPPRLVSAYLKP
jgi:uncharacterized protein DUF6883